MTKMTLYNVDRMLRPYPVLRDKRSRRLRRWRDGCPVPARKRLNSLQILPPGVAMDLRRAKRRGRFPLSLEKSAAGCAALLALF